MINITLNFNQALQLAALIPSIFIIIYLLFAARRKSLIVVPVLYLSALSISLIYKILPLFIENDHFILDIILKAGDSFIPALSFLLIFQFMLNRIPPFIYWAVLLVPFVAAGPFVYASIYNEQLCVAIDTCFDAETVLHLNHVVMSSFIFILITLIVSRKHAEIIGDDNLRKYKYWLIISIIIYSVILLMMELAMAADLVRENNYVFSKTLVKLTFVYMVMTSIFRVFTDLFDMKHLPVSIHKTGLTEYEKVVAKKAETLLVEHKVYKEMGLNRDVFAKKLGISEHLLSKIINMEFKKTFSEITNEYRIKEAKELLERSEKPITDISFEVGFNSIASFNRVFKTATGKSPSDYREDMHRNIV